MSVVYFPQSKQICSQQLSLSEDPTIVLFLLIQDYWSIGLIAQFTAGEI